MRLDVTIDVARAPGHVFDRLLTSELLLDLVGIEEISFPHQTSSVWEKTLEVSGPLGPGARLIYHLVRSEEPPPSLPDREIILEITRYEPPYTLALRSLSDPIPVQIGFVLIPIPFGTHLTISWELRSSGLPSALLARLGMMIAGERLAHLAEVVRARLEA